MLRPDDGAWYDKDDPDDNPPQVVPELLALAQRIRGSGVVPDKPALALCAQHGGIGYCSPLCPNASVPAVTDDEAATEAIRTHFRQVKPTTYREMANEALIALRSAGFLIVHHTKET
jgi:hypothetical protein